jgi:hypothetical protein
LGDVIRSAPGHLRLALPAHRSASAGRRRGGAAADLCLGPPGRHELELVDAVGHEAGHGVVPLLLAGGGARALVI